MPETARSLFAQGDAAFRRGQWRAALQAFAGVVRASPRSIRARLRIADALLNLGKRELAMDVYKAMATDAARGGHPLVALVATKMLLLLDPGIDDVPQLLAELYAAGSERLGPLLGSEAQRGPDDASAHALIEEGDALCIAAAAAAYAPFHERQLPTNGRLPALPLLSLLDEDAFIKILNHLRLRRFADDEIIVREGEHGESFFMVADGDVLVKRDIEDEDGGVVLAHLHRGAIFGEMALISEEPRQASVVAKGDVDILELRRSDLVVAAATSRSILEALKAFTRERFLRNLTATHPFFSGLSRDERHRVMDCFRVVTFPAGNEVISEGAAGPGLFLLLGGTATVSKRASAERVHLATLRGGDVCGEMSLLGAQATVATVTAQEELEVLFLSHEDVQDVVRAHPEVMKYLAGLTDERMRRNRALLHGRGLLEDDEHVMI